MNDAGTQRITRTENNTESDTENHVKNQMTRRQFLGRMAWLGAGAVGASTFGWATRYEPDWIEIVRREMPIANLSLAFRGLTIAHISDLHISSWMTQARLQHIVRIVNGLKPDVVALTGDFVSRRREEHAHVITTTLSTLAPRLDAFAVLGNHDHWSNAAFIRRALRKSGMQELRNSFHTLRRDGETLHICGLDDAWARAADVGRVLETLPRDGAAILLAHEPDFADEYAQAKRFDLQLSGHSHGGQIRAPLIGPLHLPAYGRKYHTAQYSVGTAKPLTLYVNRGVGMVWPFVRFNCRPEITLFTLRPRP
jgi:predicted MPP superfamily phosphohydrolase